MTYNTTLTTRPFQLRGERLMHLMPLWDALVPVAAACPAWTSMRVYCDITTGDTVAMWDGGDLLADLVGVTLEPGGPTDMDYCGYVWHADGTVDEFETTNELWWCIDDLLWGFDDDCVLNLLDADGCTVVDAETYRDRARLNGTVYMGDTRWDELGMDDLLADLGDQTRRPPGG